MARFDPVTRFLQGRVDGARLPGCVAALRYRGTTERPITVRHLLTNTGGIGWAPDLGPLAAAMYERGVGPDGVPPTLTHDEYLRRLAELPLSAQPGDTWGYHVGSEVLAVLLTRATGRSVADLVTEHVTGPLGLTDTGFQAVDPAR